MHALPEAKAAQAAPKPAAAAKSAPVAPAKADPVAAALKGNEKLFSGKVGLGNATIGHTGPDKQPVLGAQHRPDEGSMNAATLDFVFKNTAAAPAFITV